jgi:hypothetical protein
MVNEGNSVMAKDPNKVVMPGLRMDSMYRALKDSLKKPYIGVTQGGSSRKNAGARVAAVISQVKQPKG